MIFACLCGACSYPDFGFVPDDATTGDDSAVADSSVPGDTARDGNVDTGGDSGGDTTSDTTVSDSGAPTDSTLGDVALDTTTTDTKPPADTAPPTDTTGTDTTTTGFCASASPPHAFCNDFDESSDPLFGWTSDNLLGVGAYALDGTFLSAPHALHTQYTAADSTTGAAASVNRTLDAPLAASLTRFEADVRLDSATYSGDGTLLLKVQRSGGNGVGFGIDAGGFYMEMVGTSYHYHRVTGTPVAGKWFHVRVEGTLQITSGSANVWIDGVLAGSATGESSARDEGTTRNFIVGFYGDPAIPVFGAHFDNATVDFP